jgi:uncharacterized surface protein with fasciclin (FAS1) repeats
MLSHRTPLLVVAALALVAYSPVQAQEERQQQPQTIFAVLEAQGNHTTLLNAIRAAGLVETLQGEGPYTLFAPTDEAFAALPEGKLEELMANPEALKELLSFHIAASAVRTADVTEPVSLTTIEGSTVQVVRDGEIVRLEVPAPAAEVRTGEERAAPAMRATITNPDIAASNGVILVIDRVLLIDG